VPKESCSVYPRYSKMSCLRRRLQLISMRVSSNRLIWANVTMSLVQADVGIILFKPTKSKVLSFHSVHLSDRTLTLLFTNVPRENIMVDSNSNFIQRHHKGNRGGDGRGHTATLSLSKKITVSSKSLVLHTVIHGARRQRSREQMDKEVSVSRRSGFMQQHCGGPA